jgi:hypothetical protein
MDPQPILALSAGTSLMAAEKVDSNALAMGKTKSEDDIAIDEINASSGLDRITSRQTHRSRRSEIDPFTEPPDGGLNAWLKAFGCFLMYANTLYVSNPKIPPGGGLSMPQLFSNLAQQSPGAFKWPLAPTKPTTSARSSHLILHPR